MNNDANDVEEIHITIQKYKAKMCLLKVIMKVNLNKPLLKK